MTKYEPKADEVYVTAKPIEWRDFHGRDTPEQWSHSSTSSLVRFVAAAEILMTNDPVRSRSEGEAAFRRGLAALYRELDGRVPRRREP